MAYEGDVNICDLRQEIELLFGEPVKVTMNLSRLKGQAKGDAALLEKEIAVGTAIAGRRPHESVREDLPHAALPLSTIKQ